MSAYPIIQVPDVADLPEQLGTKEKFWFFTQDAHYLFKLGRADMGENWSEKIACELCNFLGLPHANYDFGIWRGQIGVVSITIVPKDGRLILGNELLDKAYRNYPSQDVRGVSQHTISRVAALMQTPMTKVLLPLDYEPSTRIKTALDVFVGYLMLDAWIGNSDRHHQNWGFILTPSGLVHLASTFDHASSLGCHETEANRLKRLNTLDSGYHISNYVTKARSALYMKPHSQKPLTTLDAFMHLAVKRKRAALAWLEALETVSVVDCQNTFARIPSHLIFQLAIEFALEMLKLNRQRLLNLKNQLL